MRVGALVTELGRHVGATAEAVVGLSRHLRVPLVGWLDESVAERLGVVDVTVLAVRPDRYVGLRDDRGDPDAVAAYLDELVS
jgi:hypothetical protein